MIPRVQTQTNFTPKSTFSPLRSGLLQRKCACGSHMIAGGECSECRKEPAVLQRQPITQTRPAVPAIVGQVLHSTGQPLDATTRAFMESRFGHDFSRVRIHRDAPAGESARAVNALAYTVGQDVVFGGRQYAPETMGGRKLLAHELAHVVQQRNATYPVGGLTLADSTWEHEADTAAEAAVAGRPVPVALRATAGPQLARQQLHTETLTTPTDAAGRKVEVTRAVTPGKCAEVPETRTNADSEITRTRAAIELSYCRGRTSASAKGEIDYSDVTNTIRQAVNSAPNFLSNPNQQALSDLEQAFKRVAPRANVRFDWQVGGTKVEVTGSGTASVEGGASGKAGATVSGRIGKTRVTGGVEVSGGTQEEEKVIFTATLGGGAPEIPNCFKCVCEDPTKTFACVIEPETPGKTPPPKPKQILYIPLFFEYADRIPRKGSEEDYKNALARVIDHLREGYTVASIEGRTSPEGPLKGRRGFEGGNIELAKKRAQQAKDGLDGALSKAIGKEELKFRNADTIRRLKAAQSARFDVRGLAPGGEIPSAELFGTGSKGEVSERDMLKHLRQTLKKPAKPGELDPLAKEHVIGEGLPADVRAEVEAEVEVFRTGKRGGKKLKDRELLETIYKPLRRALITLNPAKPFLVGEQRPKEELEKAVGKPMDKCLPEHEDVFKGKTIPNDKLYEGECRPKGVGEKVK